MTTEERMMFHLKPDFGERLLDNITRDEMQLFLDRKAVQYSRSLVSHLRWDLNAVFKMALSDGCVGHNPAAVLFTPSCKPEAERKVMSKEQIRLALGALSLRERIVFRMAVFDGMRPGEILAVRVGNVHATAIHVDQRVYRGNLDTPKGRKGKRTARVVALSPGTLMLLEAWKSTLQDQTPGALLFPNERSTPLSRDNLWRQCILPKLEKVHLEWANFQVLRRTNASLSKKAKIDAKVSADQRGHGLGVSLEVYTISDLAQKIEAVTRLEAAIIH